MAIEVTNRDLTRDPGIVHFKTGIEITDARIPGKKAFAYEHRYDRGADRLRDGCELEHRIGINRARLAYFTNAKALGKYDLILENDRNRDARDPRRPHLVLGEFLELRGGTLDFFEAEFVRPTRGSR